MTAEPVSGRGPNEQYEQQMHDAAAEHARQYALLKEQLDELERQRKNVDSSYETLNHEWRAYTLEVYGEARELTVPIVHPFTGEQLVAYLRADETTKVHLDDWEHPETRRKMPGARRFLPPEQIAALCNAPKVSAVKWRAAVESGAVPADVAAQVMEFGTKAGYIAFTKPDGDPSS